MRYLQVKLHVKNADRDPKIKGVWLEIPWMNREARAISYLGKRYRFGIRSENCPAIDVRTLYLLGYNNKEDSGIASRPITISSDNCLAWVGLCLETLLGWDMRCRRSSRIKQKETEEKISSLIIDGDEIKFDSKAQDKIAKTLMFSAEDYLNYNFSKI